MSGDAIAAGTLVYFAPVGEGGLARYAVCQAQAISATGVHVIFLGPQHLRHELESRAPQIEFQLLPELDGGTNRVRKLWNWIRSLRINARIAQQIALKRNADAVLFTAFAEYFSPFWISYFRTLRKTGIAIGAVVHDPIRDFQIGPKWWHNYCIRTCYSAIDTAFQHDNTPLDVGGASHPPTIRKISFGPFDVPVPTQPLTKQDVRRRLGLSQSAVVLLSFGHIRDGKNLDLAISALAKHPEVHLLVVGREQSSAQKPVAHYQGLAENLGVAEQCHWVNSFVPEDDVYTYFRAADLLLLLYSSDFHSASGVLNNAGQFRLPVLASSGGGPLKSIVNQYQLGLFVRPDCATEAERGLSDLINHPPDLQWEEYLADHSWTENASQVIEALMSAHGNSAAGPAS